MWQDSYAIGVEAIDAQHKGLFEYVGRLLESSNNDHWPPAAARRDEISEAIGVLKYYALEHFDTEEEYQRSINYSDYEAHKAKHEALKLEVIRFEDELTASNFDPQVVKKFLGFVLAWLIFHVVQEDGDIRRDRNRQKAALTGEYIRRFADRSKEVLSVFAESEDAEPEIAEYSTGCSIPDRGLCYQIGLVGGLSGSNCAVIFSEGFTAHILQAMAGSTGTVPFSALDGMLNAVAARIAESIAYEGAAYGIGRPGVVDIGSLPKTTGGFRLGLGFGDVDVVMF